MGLQLAPGFISGSGTYQHPVELFRNLLEGLSGGGQKGTLTPTSFAMTPSGSLMQLTVAAGFAVIAGEENSSQGSYFVWSNASEVLAWPAHSAQGRWDTLILRVIDTQYGVDASPEGAYWEIVQGTPAGSPTKIPDVEFQGGGDFYRPGAWWRVADVLVGSTDLNMAATDITDYRALAIPYQQRVESSYLFQQTVKFTASGTFTKANYPGLKKVLVETQADGGGGGGNQAAASGACSAGAGGGGGGYARGFIDAATLASSVTVTVGTGGAGGVGNNNGTAGAGASFGAHVVATGGAGGNVRPSNSAAYGENGGAGGIGTAGDVLAAGDAGVSCWGDASLVISGSGGGSYMGGGGRAVRGISAAQTAVGIAGQNYGGGGGGSMATSTGAANNGGAGAPGVVLVNLYF